MDETYKIKKLEWELFHPLCHVSNPSGYVIMNEEKDIHEVMRDGRSLARKDTLEEAKAAAQKHHDNEISKHLEVVGAKSVVCRRCNDAEAIAPSKLCQSCFIEIINNKEVVG